ncbi:hypothetical protein HYH02_009817 [Chlamydomonas schloesseri]|uniref:Uncharacterized protein n=1 Tax=Chlamydomonas schloesseri TaxID=2026947 RepID=A0A835TQ61_9CHLO|nr:hypothetical protein HYH02_009817 [Chlamydomonas schloesseri]|eukprot:KAG2442025.1 hypothetical protein HYH02_009817 [Chlamydomonas schloesseri]
MPFGSQWLETEAACGFSQEDGNALGRKQHGGRPWTTVLQGIRRSLDVHIKSYYKVDSAFATAARYASASDKLRVLARALTDTGLVDFCCVYLVHPSRGTFGVAALSGAGSELYPPLLTQATPNLGDAKPMVAADVCGSTPALNVFTRSVFQVQDSNWAVEDVVASKAPWYYDCASAVNGFGLPQEAAWLRRVGMRSVLALPCMAAAAQPASPASALGFGHTGCSGNATCGTASSAVTGVLTVATRQKTLDHLLLRKLEELCCRLAPIVSDAVAEHSRLLSNRRLVGRYESVSDFAHAVLGEMLNLDRAVAVSVAASNAVAAGSATGLTPSQARQTQRQNSIAAAAAAAGAGARSCSGGKHGPASAEARFDAAAAVEAAKAAGFGWTAPASSVTPTSVSASTKTSGFASCLARLRSKGHDSKAAAASAAAAAACSSATAAPTSPTCASTPTTATSGATPGSADMQQSSQEAVWSASFSTSAPTQHTTQQSQQQHAPACAAAAAVAAAASMQLQQQLHAADTFCSATSRAGTGCGLSSGAGGLSTAVTAADGLPSAVTSSALPSCGALATPSTVTAAVASAPTQATSASVSTTLDAFQSLAAAASLPLPAVCTALSAHRALPAECSVSAARGHEEEEEEEEEEDAEELRWQAPAQRIALAASGTARTLPSRPSETMASVRDLVQTAAFGSGVAANEPAATTAGAHGGAASAMAACCADALALEAMQASRSTRSLSCLEFSGGGMNAMAAEALGSGNGNSNSSGIRSGRCTASPTAVAEACARARAAARLEASADTDTAGQVVAAHMKYDSNSTPFCAASGQQHHHHQQQHQHQSVVPEPTACASPRGSGDGREFLYGRDVGFMLDDSSLYGSGGGAGEWRSGLAPGGTNASAGCGGGGSFMLPNSAYSSRGGSRVMHRGVPIEPSIGPTSAGLYGSSSAAGRFGGGSTYASAVAAAAAAAASASLTPYLSPIRVGGGGGGASACASERSLASHDTTATLATTTFASSAAMGGFGGAGTSTAQLTLTAGGHGLSGAAAAGSAASALDYYVCAAASAAPDGTVADGGCDSAGASAAPAAGPSSRWSRDSATAAAAMWGSEASDAIAAAMRFTAGAGPHAAPQVPSAGFQAPVTHRVRGGCAVPLAGISGAGQLFGIRESGPMPSASTLIGSGSGGLPRGCRSAGSASGGCDSGSNGGNPCSSGDVCVSITDMALPPGMTACDAVKCGVQDPAPMARRAAVAFSGSASAASCARW